MSYSGTFDDITDDRELSNLERKDELADILSPHFNLEFKMDGKDVEEIFKGVLTDESQVSLFKVLDVGRRTSNKFSFHRNLKTK